ncbi:hypothetical protein HF086_014771 [Spodoptera exigua]|uniref:Fatty acyl-CoA reductase n=1 Tax=Spodoptera exigua TaxID=7107 RepID=A0A922SGL4_SPOEX|nr:hypothetical protein HF086_014771 [Spodoptera exigua]
MAATQLISVSDVIAGDLNKNENETKYCPQCNDSVDENMNNTNDNLTEVQKFYNGKNILITGATGFLGKILVEKLLRCCPGVENLYLLVRQKRGKDIYTRMEEIFDDPVFSRLKEEVPKFRHKVVVVPADCEAAGLGLTLTDRQMLTEKVNIIFHSAATVKFDEHLRAALVTNVMAPLHLLRLARDVKKLDVLMHISTAYSNSHLPMIEERFYPCEANCEQLHQMVDKLTDDQLNIMLPKILGPWPNTYTFTKALAEKELRASAGGMPIGIFRPAIVISTAKEPLKGWLDNMYGPTGVAVGSGKMLKVYRKIHKFSSVLSYFCTREIKFCNSRTRELWEKTSEADKKTLLSAPDNKVYFLHPGCLRFMVDIIIIVVNTFVILYCTVRVKKRDFINIITYVCN